MRCLAISYSGMEDITALEIKELIGKESEIIEGAVLFEATMEEMAKYCYLGQGVNRVLLLDTDISKYGKTFRVDADEREKIIEVAEKIEGKVDLKNPDVVVYAYRDYVGIDFSGDLSKRDYKIKTSRDDLKGTIAYALVRLSGYCNEKSFLSLNAKAGTIAIEAALFGSGRSVNYFNKTKFPFLKFFKIDLGKFDEEVKEVKVYASDNPGYLKLVQSNAKVAGADVAFGREDKVGKSQHGSSEAGTADCVVKYSREEAEIKGLEKEREIKHGKETLKIASFKKH